jgi:hypothetical protein
MGPDVDDIAVIDHVAYVAEGGVGLHLFDITNIRHPTKIGVVELATLMPSGLWVRSLGVRLARATATTLYTVDSIPGQMRLFDVSAPEVPEERGRWPLKFDGRPAMTASGNQVYMAFADGLIEVAAVDSGGSFSVLHSGQFSELVDATDVAIAAGVLVVTARDATGIVEIPPVEQSVLRIAQLFPMSASAADIEGDVIYLGTGPRSLTIATKLSNGGHQGAVVYLPRIAVGEAGSRQQ